MNAPLRAGSTESLQSMAQRYYDKHQGDEGAALIDLIAAGNKNSKIVSGLVEFAWRTMLANVFRIDRASAIRKADVIVTSQVRHYTKAEAFERAQNRALAAPQTNMTVLLGTYYKDSNGKKFRLADATADQLAPVAARYMGQGAHMMHTGRYLQAVASATPKGKTVGTVLSEADLMRLRSAV